MIDPKNVIILLDPGHGSNTPGKCSPDKSVYEWKWVREEAALIQVQLKALGFDTIEQLVIDLLNNGYKFNL